jgi:hypothetical protein
MKTYRLGDNQSETYDQIITPDGTVLVAKDEHGCIGCAFERGGRDNVDGLYCADTPFCSDHIRTDGRSVIWVKA